MRETARTRGAKARAIEGSATDCSKISVAGTLQSGFHCVKPILRETTVWCRRMPEPCTASLIPG
jgi:hypothetical protein